MNAIAAWNEFGIDPGQANHDFRVSGEASKHLLIAIRCIEDDNAIAIEHVKKAMLLLELPAPLVSEGSSARVVPKLASGGLASWQVNRIASYVNDNMEGRILLVDLARLVNLSTSYFSAVFRASFGVSPHNYILQQRIEFAKKQMRFTESSLSEIALACGLSDQAHLSRTFRRITGMTPSAWRRFTTRKRDDGAHLLVVADGIGSATPTFNRLSRQLASAV